MRKARLREGPGRIVSGCDVEQPPQGWREQDDDGRDEHGHDRQKRDEAAVGKMIVHGQATPAATRAMARGKLSPNTWPTFCLLLRPKAT